MPDQKPTLEYWTGKSRPWRLPVIVLTVVMVILLVFLLWIAGAYLSGFSERGP